MPKYEFVPSKNSGKKVSNIMKCFSVHMTLGILEGILLAGTRRDVIRTGNASKSTSCIYVQWGKKYALHPEKVFTAEICLQGNHAPPKFMQIEGWEDPIPTRHVLHPNQNCTKDRALVAIGLFTNTHSLVALESTPEGSLKTIIKFASLSRKNPVRRIMMGTHYSRKHDRTIKQMIYIMKKNSGILLVGNAPEHEDILIRWDGSELHMIHKPDLSQIIA